MRYPVGQAGWARTCGAVETLHERPIFSVHTKEFVQIVSPTDDFTSRTRRLSKCRCRHG